MLIDDIFFDKIFFLGVLKMRAIIAVSYNADWITILSSTVSQTTPFFVSIYVSENLRKKSIILKPRVNLLGLFFVQNSKFIIESLL